jgi:prepilin-type N-terminal cleavage/methylation domain-containing protein
MHDVKFGRENGFTVVEIVVVLIVMGIIAAFVVARGITWEADADVEAEVLKTRLRLTQANAMNASAFWGVQTDTNGGVYWMGSIDGAGNVTRVPFPGEQSDSVRLVDIDLKVVPAGTYSFDSRGIPHYAAHGATPPGNPLAADKPVLVQKTDASETHSFSITENTGFIQ